MASSREVLDDPPDKVNSFALDGLPIPNASPPAIPGDD
ncbi:hypothetical protein VTO73DRAFT_2789 [Trametes versicolor]